MGMDVKRRRLLIRLALVAVWIALGVLLFVMNRGHAILLDNRNLTSPEMRAPDIIKVTVNRLKPLELFRGDRDIVDVGGGKQRITVEFSDGKAPFSASFSLPLGPDIFILSIPKMINGIEPFFEKFVSTQTESRSSDNDDQAQSSGP